MNFVIRFTLRKMHIKALMAFIVFLLVTALAPYLISLEFWAFNFWFSDNYACDIFWFGNKAWLARSVDCLCAVSQNTQTVQNDDSANLQIYIIKMAAYMWIVYGFWKNHISISKTQWYKRAYEKVSDVPESRVWFASKNQTPCRIH